MRLLYMKITCFNLSFHDFGHLKKFSVQNLPKVKLVKVEVSSNIAQNHLTITGIYMNSHLKFERD